MEKVKVAYPVVNEAIHSENYQGQESFVLKSIAASLAGASIPAVIFYFLM